MAFLPAAGCCAGLGEQSRSSPTIPRRTCAEKRPPSCPKRPSNGPQHPFQCNPDGDRLADKSLEGEDATAGVHCGTRRSGDVAGLCGGSGASAAKRQIPCRSNSRQGSSSLSISWSRNRLAYRSRQTCSRSPMRRSNSGATTIKPLAGRPPISLGGVGHLRGMARFLGASALPQSTT